MHELVSVPHGKNCVTDQVLYHVACRGPEFDLFPFLKQNGMTAMAYCPLAQFGALDRDVVRSRTLNAIAEKHGASLAQVMLAFILRNENLIPIPKSSTPAHVEDNAKALTLTLDGVEYHGVCAIGYDADQDAFVTTFTAMSEDGQTVWGIRAAEQE